MVESSRFGWIMGMKSCVYNISQTEQGFWVEVTGFYFCAVHGLGAGHSIVLSSLVTD